ncbi:MAG: spermidine synthase [Planctomycetota bacterium]
MRVDRRRSLLLLRLTALSCACLLLELALIRWMPMRVRVLAYFPNLILIGAFLGLGLGSLLSRCRSLLASWPALFCTLIGITSLLARVVFTQNSPTEHLWLLYYDLPANAPVIENLVLPIVISFVMSAAVFIPLGQILGECFKSCADAQVLGSGYIANLFGSIAGVVAFSICAWLRTPPAVWFGAALVLLIPEFLALRYIAHFLALIVASLALIALSDPAQIYSPYYALSFGRNPEGVSGYYLRANGSLHQYALDMVNAPVDPSSPEAATQRGYMQPLQLLGRAPRRALVLGAGTGNDVAALLRLSPTNVDAVEIDPSIVDIGRRIHPNKPYDDQRVRVIVADARTFLATSKSRYDLIVFGTLDSMTRLSAVSQVRLDNFVYTEEAFRAARGRLTPDGGIVLYFMVADSFIHERMLAMLTAAFDEPPLVMREDRTVFNTVYLAGPGFAELRANSSAASAVRVQAAPLDVTIPTDDWPFLYLKERALSGFHATLLAIVGGIAALSVFGARALGRRRDETLRGSGDFEFFCYGAGFLLLETTSITAMNLLWGATWISSAVVLGAVLLMALTGTIFARRRWLNSKRILIGLGLSLAAVGLLPHEWLLFDGWLARLAMSAAIAGLPVFFGSAAFAVRFLNCAAADQAYAWNILGAVLGGLLEYAAIIIGLKALLGVSGVFYLAGLLCSARAAARKVALPT